MLKQLAKWERTSKYIVLLFAALMAISLVIFYAPGRNSASNLDPTKNTEVVAKVGSATITSLTSRASGKTTRRCSAAVSTWPN